MLTKKFSEYDDCAKIEYIVFGQCNNNCCFCYQKMFNNIKDPYLMTKKSIVERFLKLEDYLDWHAFVHKKKILPPKVEIILIGGELFCWSNPEIVDAFKTIADITLEWEKKYSRKFHIVLVTNLLYEDIGDLLETFKYVKSKGLVNSSPIITSFDFRGRYSEKLPFELFSKNVNTLLNLPEYAEFKLAFDIIRTKGLLDAMLGKDHQQELQFFQDIYDNPKCLLSMDNLSYLTTQKDVVKDLILDFSESIECYKLLYQKFPNLFNTIHNYKQEQFRTCLNRTKCILDTEIHDDPCFYDHFGNTPQTLDLFRNISDNKADVIEAVLKKYNCEYCDFYTQCNLECPAMRNNKTSYDKCDLKEVFKWINQSV